MAELTFFTGNGKESIIGLTIIFIVGFFLLFAFITEFWKPYKPKEEKNGR